MDNVPLIGSDLGEIARGRQKIESFFIRIFAFEATFSWEWDHIDVSYTGDSEPQVARER
jgi:hypothetical protein